MEATIRRLALANAVKYGGEANPKAVIGNVVKEYPEAKKDLSRTTRIINAIVEEVNGLPLERQEEELLKLDPDHKEKQQAKRLERKEQANELPPLQNAEQGKVVTRMPPEPSKYAHLGHAMSFLINYLYAKMYDGKVILRLDDTNPEKASQEYVDAMQEDIIGYLGATPDRTVFASDHMDQYYEYAERLIEAGYAYACTCPQEEIRRQRREQAACPHRDQTREETSRTWERMKAGEPVAGSVVLRLKVDMHHKNAVMRDPVIYRCSYTPHYRTGTAYKVWPMYDFESAVEEELCGVTHVMRGNEFDTRIELQRHIGELLGFKEVHYKHYGRFTVKDATTKGREIRELIANGDYIGWDDPRLVTLRALKRRGIVKEAYYELAKKVGMSKQLTTLDFSVIAAINRNLLDKRAKRFFCVKQPVTIKVTGLPEDLKRFTLSYHPDEEKGKRILPATKEYYVERRDHEAIKPGIIIRFMDAMNLKKTDDGTYAYVSQDYEDYTSLPSKGPLIHFIPKDGNERRITIFLPDTKTIEAVAEANINTLAEGDIIQFERYAFCRLDRGGERPVFWYTHP
ncbi:glutamate--tRNA ligase [Candidatus Woesearchaeota archaeon]|nr:glutamate--tRNA ligase [Candidatus Woesearchaeota archaeon]